MIYLFQLVKKVLHRFNFSDQDFFGKNMVKNNTLMAAMAVSLAVIITDSDDN
jgi:hypothetical protein